jgi:mannan endo-1,4-beta-mannosidase
VRPNLRRIAGLMAIVTALSIGATATVGAATPPRKMALGVSLIPYDDMDKLDQFTTDTGRAPAIVSVWSAWGGANKELPTGLLDSLRTRGSVPMIIWEPTNPSNEFDSSFTYRKIINGRYDAYLRRFAQDAKDYDGPILLRFAHEANGYWFNWSTSRWDNTPKRYRMAWRHIWNIFRGPGGVGATNVKFLWSQNLPCKDCDSMASIYPGDKYVDYAGFSAFNWGTPTMRWKSMVTTFSTSMKAVTAITSKPIIVAETGSAHVGGDKSAWITNGYPAVYAKWPRIKAIVYFNYNGLLEPTPKRDWRLQTPDDGPLQAYATILEDIRFQGRIQ